MLVFIQKTLLVFYSFKAIHFRKPSCETALAKPHIFYPNSYSDDFPTVLQTKL